MQSPQFHPDEDARLVALEQLRILDTTGEQAYDDLVALAAQICGTPVSLVSLVDRSRQWFKARHGLTASETPRSLAFCAHAILEDSGPFIVPDAHVDPRFHDNPLVTADPFVRFYAGVPLHEPSRRLPIGTLCVIHDQPHSIDDEQQAMLAALGRQAERLLEARLKAMQLTERNDELIAAHAEVEAARREAEAASAAKGRFLAVMSHEIRTPLNGIIGSAQLLERECVDEQQAERIATIVSCGDGLLTLINDILDLSRLEAGAVEVETVPVALADLIEEAVRPLQPAATSKGLCLTWAIADDLPPTLLGDPARLRQVLLNLLGNAIKFTHRGGAYLDCSRLGEDRWLIEVVDSGIGITTEQAQIIFDPFTQADASTTRRYGGTGLGLSVVRQVVDLMGGSVRAEPVAEGGSRFSVELPLRPCSGSSASPLPPATTLPDCRGLPAAVREHLACVIRLTGLGDAVAGWRTGLSGATLQLCAPGGVDPVALSLPLSRQRLERALRRIEATPSGIEIAPDRAAPARVLVAEDDPVNQRVIQSLLENLGARVTVVGDGLAAVTAIRGAAWDLAFLDHHMPGIDGLEVARRIRADGNRLPLVALTADATGDQRHRCLAAGMDAYLSKPVRRSELATVLAEYCRPSAA